MTGGPVRPAGNGSLSAQGGSRVHLAPPREAMLLSSFACSSALASLPR